MKSSGTLPEKRRVWMLPWAGVLAATLLLSAARDPGGTGFAVAAPAGSAGPAAPVRQGTAEDAEQLCTALPPKSEVVNVYDGLNGDRLPQCTASYSVGVPRGLQPWANLAVTLYPDSSAARAAVDDRRNTIPEEAPRAVPAAYGDYGFDIPAQTRGGAIVRADGLIFSRGACLVSGYASLPERTGDPARPPDELRALARQADEKLGALPLCSRGFAAPTPSSTSAGPAATPSKTAQPEVDLKVQNVEVVQVVQYSDNSIRLVAGRKTVVRVFALAETPPGSTNRDKEYLTRASLTFRANGAEEKELRPIDQYAGVKPFKSPDRNDRFASINFVIESEQAIAGPFTLKATINPDREVNETDFANNVAELKLDFVQRNGLRVGYLRMGNKPPVANQYRWPTDSIANHGPLLKTFFPVPDAGIQYYELPWRARTTRDLGNSDTGSELLLDLLEFRARMQADIPDIIAAWLPDNYASQSDFGGLAYKGRPAVLGIDYVASEFPKEALAHEVGHALGLEHTGTTGDPNPPCRISKAPANYWPASYENSAAIGEPGFDTQSMVVIPRTAHDIMSYCSGTSWISPFHYQKLFDANSRAPNAGLPAMRGYIARGWASLLGRETVFQLTRQPGAGPGGSTREGVAGGHLMPNLSGSLLAALSPPSSRAALQEGTGSHCMRFLGANGSLLYARCFDLMVAPAETESSDPARDIGGFVLELPDPGDVARVVLVRDESGQARELGALEVSSNAPALSITSPKEGDRWEGEQTIAWSASDADGDELRYDIMYSADGRVSWYPVAVNLRESAYTFSTDEILPGEQAFIRIVASDGYNTSEADVGPLVVARQANSPGLPPRAPGAGPGPGRSGESSGDSSAGLIAAFIGGMALVLLVGGALLAIFLRRSPARQAAGMSPGQPQTPPPHGNLTYPQYPAQQAPLTEPSAALPAQPTVPRRAGKALPILLLVLVPAGLIAAFLIFTWRLPVSTGGSPSPTAGVIQPTAMPTRVSTTSASSTTTTAPEVIQPTAMPTGVSTSTAEPATQPAATATRIPFNTPTAGNTVAPADPRSHTFRLTLEDFSEDRPFISDAIEAADGAQHHLRVTAQQYEDPGGGGETGQPVVVSIAVQDADENTSLDMWLASSQEIVDEFSEVTRLLSVNLELAQEDKSYELTGGEGWTLKVKVNSMTLDQEPTLSGGAASPYPVFSTLDLTVEVRPG